ncbi:folylpolyglutamate synthase/dihydrofolate synthase family protein [Ferruginibacter sp. HRS2-29]|uniref:bifunctional folylpolyglutamate synthase/dihydrofolate synthase n=1 Tax=Ferruginibacter sp. HRS2-29 TaxID=2487334 RepID=UPI0020CC53E1|nr:folylpolyglutamate synthase/dihydrofolate synthase family protein [Ferruginibacter sp. HRS2-29]MCP9753370.1 bifunctional folylpolyglutamate synthase/dihydrofolate synthase [Ferruginibacter sp. HRS2-29]
MTYQQTLEYLYDQLPMFTRIGAAAYKEDLDNTIALCEALGNPQHKFKSIHIAGTNGKGSTSHMLAAMLQQAGYKTGLYTSPHIKDFGERIRINGQMIDEAFVVDFAERTKQLAHDIQPSFFELTVAMAFEYFATEKVDIAVVETGLGGRLDSTNVITPLLSVITNIGFDHVQLLGNTLEKIAGEKAGIIKQQVPVVIGEYLPETRPVFEAKAISMQAPVYFAEELFEIGGPKQSGKLHLTVSDKSNGHAEDFQLDLKGLYQAKNLRTVLAAEKILHESGFPISKADNKYALANVKKLTGLAGRWDIIQGSPVIIHDVAHNEDGIGQVLQQLVHDYPDAGFHFVLGFVKDKDVIHVLELFPKDAKYYFTNAHIPRALSAKELQESARSKNLTGEAFDDVNEAIDAAKKNAGDKDVIMVCGSFFIIAEIK